MVPSFEERGKKFARASDRLAIYVDDALAGLDIDHPEITRERLEILWGILDSVQRMEVTRPQSDFVRKKMGLV